MKVFISVDLEGVSGVCLEEQATEGTPHYEAARRLMRADLDAALEGCRAAGAGEIVVCDGHDRGANLLWEGLPAGVRLAQGSPASLSMLHGIDDTFDAALFIGYHAMAGTTGAVLDHTYSYDVFRVRADEYLEVGEIAINAAVAGVFGVPVVFVSGDDKTVAEAREAIPGVQGAVVKWGTMRTAARLEPPQTARAAIRDGVRAALTSTPYPAPLSFTDKPLRVTFTRSGACDAACGCPTVQRVDARTIDIPGGDYLRVFDAFLTCLALAYQTRG